METKEKDNENIIELIGHTTTKEIPQELRKFISDVYHEHIKELNKAEKEQFIEALNIRIDMHYQTVTIETFSTSYDRAKSFYDQLGN